MKDVPSPRAAHATFVCGDVVVLFGGRLAEERLNDLHILDMSSMQWTQVIPRDVTLVLGDNSFKMSRNQLLKFSSHPSQVHGPATGEAANRLPCGRSWHSLTRISQTGAVLFGGYDSDGTPLGDCWLLDTAGCKTAIQEPNRDDSLLFATNYIVNWYKNVSYRTCWIQ